MKLGRLMLITATAVGLGQLVTMTAQAKGGYQRTKTTAIKSKLFYSTSKTGKTYQANRSLINFKFKANHHLKDYRETAWLATSKTVINVHGKNRLYYYVQNSDLKAQGWVWRGYLKPGKNGFRVSRDMHPKTQNLVMAKPGKIYQFGKNPFNVRFNHSVALNDKMTYKLTQVWTVYKQAKAYRYYYVVSSDNKVKGWVWHGYLKTGQVTEQTNKPVVNTGNASKPVTNSSVNTSVGGTNTGTSTQSQKPGAGNVKPSETVPAWATDDGKRTRLVIKFKELRSFIRTGGIYKPGLYTTNFNNGPKFFVIKHENISYRVDKTNSYRHLYYFYGFENGVEKKLDYFLQTQYGSVPVNGDILRNSGAFMSINAPEAQKKYDETNSNYDTNPPRWYQLNVDNRDYTLWQYNLNTKTWNKTKDHLNSAYSV
ncbi:hypothetical protein [Lactiplantibacillus daowaiensis]|uniref:D-alanyl-D-alanine carboxypeptidase n=1 Tax=Lactiplantibacillus daowaiensis TaxID=2559918 RepID=A0ABW1S1E0_9LACO|nr:hypothetical protein [Lactiplantibacillus daowaiensis]